MDFLSKEQIEKLKLNKDEVSKQWGKAGSAVGLEIWRIEKLKVVPQPKTSYGAFYAGDSYIVLNTFNPPGLKTLAWDIHFWIGNDSSQDEKGVAAYKTVELDEYLGGAPIQHREVQGHESELFQSYFPKGIRVMKGGVDGGFNKVKPKEYKPRLLQIKGRRRVRLVEVPLEAASVNSGDVFILDLGLLIIQFNGQKAGTFERSKATEICRALDGERGQVPEVVVFDEFSSPEEWPKEWVERLGKGPYKSAAEGGDDLAFEKTASARTLLRLSNASGTMQMTKVAEGTAIKRDMLQKDDVFIVDFGNEVFTWVGTGASREERNHGISYALKYLRDNKRDEATPITVTLQGHESDYFWGLFGK